jgi:hypothetical protein
MASNFTHFLLKLSDDPQLLEKFKQNPDSAMDGEGLTPAEKTLLLSGNVQLIRSAIVNDPDHKKAMGISPEQTFSAVILVIPIVHGVIPDSSKS